MSTPRVLAEPPLTRDLVRAGHFAKEPFVLADVGASGGIAAHWRVFAPDLRAFGFDPLVKEVERLNREECSPGVRYFEGFVGSEAFERKVDWSASAFERSSAARALDLLGMSFTRRFNHDDPDIVHSAQRFSLDRFFSQQGVGNVDFIKIDTDGADYAVLHGARETIGKRGVLGLFVECQLNGEAHPEAGTFSNTDRLLRELGFVLFDLDVYRYSRAPLPARFLHDLPAQTVQGPVAWAEAVYFRDLARGGLATPGKLLKLLCLFEIFGFPDCAAELLVARRAELAGALDVDAALDTLARQQDPAAAGFRELNQRFERQPQAFYPEPGDGNPAVLRLQGEIEALLSSTSWRITAPLRRLKRLFRR